MLSQVCMLIDYGAAERESRAGLLARTILGRESGEFCWVAMALALESEVV